MHFVLFRQEEMGLGGETAWPEKERETNMLFGPAQVRQGRGLLQSTGS
jgi:hypothetical protein